MKNETTIFDLLRPKPGDKYTRFEAYYDLLSRAATTSYLHCRHRRELEIQEGQFVTTILELATAWNWNRPVVKSFIDELQSLNILQYEKYYSTTIFTIRTSQALEFPLATKQDFITAFFVQFEQLLLCKNRVKNLCNFCGKFCEIIVEKKDPTNSFVFKDFQKSHFISSLTFSMLATLTRQYAIRQAESCQSESAGGSTMDEQALFDMLTKYSEAYSKLSASCNLPEIPGMLQRLNSHVKEIFQAFISIADTRPENSPESDFGPSGEFSPKTNPTLSPYVKAPKTGKKTAIPEGKSSLLRYTKKFFEMSLRITQNFGLGKPNPSPPQKWVGAFHKSASCGSLFLS